MRFIQSTCDSFNSNTKTVKHNLTNKINRTNKRYRGARHEKKRKYL